MGLVHLVGRRVWATCPPVRLEPEGAGITVGAESAVRAALGAGARRNHVDPSIGWRPATQFSGANEERRRGGML